ncbi:carbonic anhydrase [Scandinavium sp. NPDC088450]|uniref:carbonic anhydrase n=1 Tax=Scandinavium sp. NPDC088450 TaxID=3364514 RepID=UPI00384DB6F9
MIRHVKYAAVPFLIYASACAAQVNTTHWGYQNENGPDHWGSITQDFQLCATGKNQSPIDIKKASKTTLSHLDLAFKAGPQTVINNGHTIQVNVSEGNTLKLDDELYTLNQFHFHSPSENEINGKHFPLEMHMVYKSTTGDLAVLAVMFEQGDENKALAGLWEHLPLKEGNQSTLTTPVQVKDLIPSPLNHYRFSGSLTTPPCSEGVSWLVFETQPQVSAQQIHKFKTIIHDNNRPVQPINGRVVVEE